MASFLFRCQRARVGGGWGQQPPSFRYFCEPIYLQGASSMLTSSHVLFVLQFNCAPTEDNYLQLFFVFLRDASSMLASFQVLFALQFNVRRRVIMCKDLSG